jgi:hypothetical protein
MKSTTHQFFMGAQFERFLHEPIGEDSNGMRLTVLSVLARLDLDPWEEAATLTRLPGVAATRKLALVLAALPERLLGGADSGTVAVRLISLLPGRLGEPPRPSATPVAAPGRPPVVGSLILYAMLMLLMFTGEWLITHTHAPPAQASAGPAPARAVAAPSSATRPAE